MEALQMLLALCPTAPCHRPSGARPRPTREWGLNGRYWSRGPADRNTVRPSSLCPHGNGQSVFPQENTGGPGVWGSGRPALSFYREDASPPVPQGSQQEQGPPACSPGGRGPPLSEDRAHPGRGRQVSSRSPERAIHQSKATQHPAGGRAGPRGPGPTRRRLRGGAWP